MARPVEERSSASEFLGKEGAPPHRRRARSVERAWADSLESPMASTSFSIFPFPRGNSRRNRLQLRSSRSNVATASSSSSSSSRLCRAMIGISVYDGGDEGLKMPTAPWMSEPLVVPHEDVLDLAKSGSRKRNGKLRDRSLSEKIRGGRSKTAMKKILQSIARLGEEAAEESTSGDLMEERKSQMEETLDMRSKAAAKRIIRRIARIGEIYSAEDEEDNEIDDQMPWIGYEQQPLTFPREKKHRVVTSAEMILAEAELARLRTEARRLKNWVKAKKAGVTDDVVDEIRATWRREELAMVKFVEPLCRNMDRAREIIEIKTGGLVVWTRRNTLVVLRGNKSQCISKETHDADVSTGNAENRKVDFDCDSELIKGTLFEREVNRLLDGLGPRFIDWWWSTPLPVDADLLPEVVANYSPPFRFCPSNSKPSLTDDELFYLRKLAKPLPTHFALGKNSRLQGLAAAVVKLWEKSPIVKIAVKVGLVNTDNQKMADELKRLTGGVLLLRNKFFIILYRGKDFIPPNVASSVLERERGLREMQNEEETARMRLLGTHNDNEKSEAGTIREFAEAEKLFKNGNSPERLMIEAEREKLEREIRRQERQLELIKLKLTRSQGELERLNYKLRTSEESVDKEFISEEERQSLRKIGLKMDEFLLLGRKGVYDGTIANIHMHWKHREVVKIITFQKNLSLITSTASLLELESGGILVAIEKTGRSHVIIIYRGKNYRAPSKILPDNLLSKSEAMERSIEIQRRGSLRFYFHQRLESLRELKEKLMTLERSNKEG